MLKRKACERSASSRFCTVYKIFRVIYVIFEWYKNHSCKKELSVEYSHDTNLNSPNTSVIAIVSTPPFQSHAVRDQVLLITNSPTYSTLSTECFLPASEIMLKQCGIGHIVNRICSAFRRRANLQSAYRELGSQLWSVRLASAVISHGSTGSLDVIGKRSTVGI